MSSKIQIFEKKIISGTYLKISSKFKIKRHRLVKNSVLAEVTHMHSMHIHTVWLFILFFIISKIPPHPRIFAFKEVLWWSSKCVNIASWELFSLCVKLLLFRFENSISLLCSWYCITWINMFVLYDLNKYNHSGTLKMKNMIELSSFTIRTLRVAWLKNAKILYQLN